jgi:hypothetical protein
MLPDDDARLVLSREASLSVAGSAVVVAMAPLVAGLDSSAVGQAVAPAASGGPAGSAEFAQDRAQARALAADASHLRTPPPLPSRRLQPALMGRPLFVVPFRLGWGQWFLIVCGALLLALAVLSFVFFMHATLDGDKSSHKPINMTIMRLAP